MNVVKAIKRFFRRPVDHDVWNLDKKSGKGNPVTVENGYLTKGSVTESVEKTRKAFDPGKNGRVFQPKEMRSHNGILTVLPETVKFVPTQRSVTPVPQDPSDFALELEKNFPAGYTDYPNQFPGPDYPGMLPKEDYDSRPSTPLTDHHAKPQPIYNGRPLTPPADYDAQGSGKKTVSFTEPAVVTPAKPHSPKQPSQDLSIQKAQEVRRDTPPAQTVTPSQGKKRSPYDVHQDVFKIQGNIMEEMKKHLLYRNREDSMESVQSSGKQSLVSENTKAGEAKTAQEVKKIPGKINMAHFERVIKL